MGCHYLAYCDNITIGGEFQEYCVCPPGTIGDEDHTDPLHPLDFPFTSGTCSKNLWTVRYVKTETALGEWVTCAANNNNQGNYNIGHFGSGRCNKCHGELRFGSTASGVYAVIDADYGTQYDCHAEDFGITDTSELSGVQSCDCREAVELPFEMWNLCANGGGADTCECTGTVRYGTEDDFFQREVIGAVNCHPDNFRTGQGYDVIEVGDSSNNRGNNTGDPVQGVFKSCYCFEGVKRLPPNPSAQYTGKSGFGMCENGANGYYLRNLNGKLEVNCLYESKTDAEAEVGAYSDPSYTVEARVYRWVLPTTSEPIEIPPSGMEVSSVEFSTSCAQSGCWVIKGTMTTGSAFNSDGAFNTFFLPKAVSPGAPSGDISYDYPYTDELWTFQPANHPCTSASFSGGDLTQEVSTCCITNAAAGWDGVSTTSKGDFIDHYRPTESFVSWAEAALTECDSTFDKTAAQVIDRPDYDEAAQGFTGTLIPFPADHIQFLNGTTFEGMTASPGVVSFVNLDPFFGQWAFEIHLDEVELRAYAGLLRGTVGVEHTVDTFLGLANFRPTGLQALDTFATQVNIHLEKTSFFTVSTHGVNDYTFLEYVNMRLVTIYKADTDFSGTGGSTGAAAGGTNDDESTLDTVRTDSEGNVCYVQVTFTMGAQYQPIETGLIPLDSVRAGRGTFLADLAPPASGPLQTGDFTHVCDGYFTASNVGVTGYTVDKTTFTNQVGQPCGPQSQMCASPTSVPDQFVSFNIPLGKEVFANPSNALDQNIFVDMVISARDTDPSTGGSAGPTPNEGDDPMQMKTTLTASIPIVSGGINIFCDGVTAKTDLKNVANADIVVGSAKDLNELSRLRIIKDVASTALSSRASEQIDTDSIESALMTLVLKGESSYFSSANGGNTNTNGYSLELEDLITIHLMEDGQATNTNSLETGLKALLDIPADDNSNSEGLDTDGYNLNGAFKFDITRSTGRAHLNPTSALLAFCPFNPPRPSAGLAQVESCITRRDVNDRGYPTRNGADGPTAMEILKADTGTMATDDLTAEVSALNGQKNNVCECTSGTSCCEAGFLQMILGENVFARDLAVDFANTIHEQYALNGRYMRAFWINPGYEWTPTQTNGRSIFSVSQKVYLFALITLDENWSSRRRMLLQTSADPTANTGSGASAAEVSFSVTPQSMLAGAFNVPVDKVASFKVELQLTKAEACMSAKERQEAMTRTVEDFLSTTASTYHSAQVLSVTVDMGSETCGAARRTIRGLKSDFSSATAEVQMLIVFVDGKDAVFNQAAFSRMPGVVAVEPVAGNRVKIDNTFTTQNSKPIGPGSAEGSGGGGGGSDMGLIIGAVCGAVGAIALVVGAVMYMKRSREMHVEAVTVQAINTADLKAQLADEV